LARTFQRRKMICHSWFVTFVYSEEYSGGSEFLIIGEQPRRVKPSEVMWGQPPSAVPRAKLDGLR
jgi:hypothetical protein